MTAALKGEGSEPKFEMVKLPFPHAPFEIFSKLYEHCENAYLLESIEGPEKLTQFSFIGFNPRLTITSRNGETVIRDPESGEETVEKAGDPLATLKKIVEARPVAYKGFRLVGGVVGYISYDMIRQWEKIPSETIDDLGFPDMEVGVYDDGIVFDHRNGKAFYHYLGCNRLPEIERLINTPSSIKTLSFDPPMTNITKQGYEEAVVKAKEYIESGDIFQVVPSKRIETRIHGDLISFYRTLREINPSPYMYYLKNGERQIIGSSPEMLVRVDDRTVGTFPIAGTRPNVESPQENARLAEELLGDPKERAEHVMLVDLARNDVGKVSKFGSVHLPEFMTVHQFSHVQHIVSNVVGTLRDDCDCFDALRALFPAGTVSGAPKVRAMEIIEELEPTRRGPYAGAVGYFSYNGNADFAITIRTLLATEGRAYIQAGAGIVADSIPENEWYETENKAQALLKALDATGGDQA